MKEPISRRAFSVATGAALFSAITSRKSFGFQVQEQKIEVHTGAETAVIRPELHGHFAEHLGSCIYGGLWVGRNSSIPNINGHRKAAVEYLRALGIPVLRWPGGCFADDYHWRDGIGPPEKRPRRVNLWWGQYTEDNSFGTHEFIELCRLIGAEPYFAGNLGSGTPQELRDWVEYCNYPSGSALSNERIANGSKEPFKVRYWGVGNENWGCGGNMTPQQYAGLYRQFATYLTPRGGIGGTNPYLIACGPSSNDPEWTRGFFDETGRRLRLVHGFAMHFYSRGSTPATEFTVEAMNEQFSSFDRMEKGIVQQHGILRGYDPDNRIGLLIDEWGVWDRIQPEDEKRYGRLWQQITMRSAAAAALGLNVFHRHADKLVMGNIAQTVNVLHSLLLTHEDRCIRTPAYWAFDMMKEHRGKSALRVHAAEVSPLGLSVSASRTGNDLILTFVNPKHDAGIRVQCALVGGSPAAAAGQMLHHADLNACNTFDSPDVIVPREHRVSVTAGRIQTELPPLSIVTAKVRLM